MTLRHIVSWKLAETDPELNRQQRRAIADALESLPPLIPEILRLEVGSNMKESDSAYDLVLVMDEANLADVGGRTDRVGMFRDFDPVDPGGAVPDPYYGGDDGFEEVLAMVERTSDAITAELAAVLGDPG